MPRQPQPPKFPSSRQLDSKIISIDMAIGTIDEGETEQLVENLTEARERGAGVLAHPLIRSVSRTQLGVLAEQGKMAPSAARLLKRIRSIANHLDPAEADNESFNGSGGGLAA